MALALSASVRSMSLNVLLVLFDPLQKRCEHIFQRSTQRGNNLWVKVEGDQSYERSVAVGGGINVKSTGLNAQTSKTTDWKAVETVGYTEVNRYSTMEFFTDTPQEVCYITIKFDEKHEKPLCTKTPIKVGSGLIINKNCYLRNPKKKKKWIDSEGTNHDPSRQGDVDDLPKNVPVSVKGRVDEHERPRDYFDQFLDT